MSHCFGGTLRINLHSYQVSAGQIAMLMGTPLKYQAVAGATLLFHYDQSIYILYMCVWLHSLCIYIYILFYITYTYIFCQLKLEMRWQDPDIRQMNHYDAWL